MGIRTDVGIHLRNSSNMVSRGMRHRTDDDILSIAVKIDEENGLVGADVTVYGTEQQLTELCFAFSEALEKAKNS